LTENITYVSIREKMNVKNSQEPQLIKKALNKIHTLLYPHKRQGIFAPDPTVECNGEEYRLASFHRRIMSSGIDMIIASILIIPMGNFMAKFIMGDELTKLRMRPELMMNDSDIGSMLQLLFSSGVLTKIIIIQLLTFILLGIYSIFFWTKKGSTPGKMLFKCRVADSETFKNITIKQGIIRFAVIPFSILPLMIGLFMIDWNSKRQALHDKAAGTVVIYKPKSS
jgi:uncharacterized RDD family membrane protein YckC